jgi:hypothetical protein
MGSRRMTERAVVRLPQLSRRNVLGGATAAPFVGGWTDAKAVTALASDPTIAICQKWLAVEDEWSRLSLLWGDVEARLMREHGWHRLSEEERRTLPIGRQLSEIDARLSVLFEEREALLDALPSGPAPNIAAIVAKLSVAERLIFEEGHSMVHGLIVQSIRDLAIVWRAR